MHTPIHSRTFRIAPIAILATLAALVTLPATGAGESNPVLRQPRAAARPAELGVIVKLRPEASAATQKLSNPAERGRKLAGRTGVTLSAGREITPRMLALRLQPGRLSRAEALDRLRADAEVEYAVIDHLRFPSATPSDPLFDGQWYLKDAEVSAVNAVAAWDLEQGLNGVVVAVLDTGVIYDHPDLGRGDENGRLLPGFDFVSGEARGNDGNGRDADPSDPGDWVSDSDQSNDTFDNCDITDSSWHGTRVAGMIGALTDNARGVSGLSWNSFILPVRVMGKCGGSDSDILAAMRWAAGLPVAGTPSNPTPARVLNLSLGSEGACERSYRDVINELTARKVLVVIAAGNEGTEVSSPGNCPGVASVAAIRHAGSKVGFSNLGPEVTIAAPGGNCVNIDGGPCLFSLDTTSNSGIRGPTNNVFTSQVDPNLGTSFSAPIVSGIASLMLSRNHNLSTEQMLARLREGARPFPDSVAASPGIPVCHVPVNDQDFQLSECLCTTDTCGGGMADAARSVAAANRPIAAVALPAVIGPGQGFSLDASGSAAACGRTVSSFAWSVMTPVDNPPGLTGEDTATVTLTAPTSGSVTLRVTVTDDQGNSDVADVVVASNDASTDAPASAGTSACAAPVTSGVTPRPATTPPPPSGGGNSGGGGGGGGGALEMATLLMLGEMLRRRRRS